MPLAATATSATPSSASSAVCSSARRSRDFHCGLRGFRRDAIRDLDLRTTGMEFASEMVVRSTLAGLAITEGPDHAAPRRPQPYPTPANLARRLAPHPLPAALLAALVVPLPGSRARRGRAGGDDRPAPRTGRGRQRHLRHPRPALRAHTAVVIGTQALFLGVFARVLRRQRGPDPRIRTGCGRCFDGDASRSASRSVPRWCSPGSSARRSPWSAGATPRSVASTPATRCASSPRRRPRVTIGVEVILASFMISVLTLDRR